MFAACRWFFAEDRGCEVKTSSGGVAHLGSLHSQRSFVPRQWRW
jgi:hypothetical protein